MIDNALLVLISGICPVFVSAGVVSWVAIWFAAKASWLALTNERIADITVHKFVLGSAIQLQKYWSSTWHRAKMTLHYLGKWPRKCTSLGEMHNSVLAS